MDLQIFYRISDKDKSKLKLPGATKERCLENFISIFGTDIKVIADNCSEDLLSYLKSKNLNIIETTLGNSASFRYALNLAINYSDETSIYFVEDDYLHLPQAKELLIEGLQNSEYVTLYDHPDKYGPLYNWGETCKIFRTASSHWKESLSTCMTFAATAKILKQDFYIWDLQTKDETPHDHKAFCCLSKSNHKLAVCIPGAACHVDLAYSLALESNQIESWAIQMMIKQIEQSIYKSWNANAIEIMEKMIHFEKHDTLELLVLLGQLEEMIKKSR